MQSEGNDMDRGIFMSYILPALIGGCLLFLLLSIQKNTFRILLGFGASLVFGCGGLYVAHALGFGLGVNWATGLVVGILGAPGFLGLVALAILL